MTDVVVVHGDCPTGADRFADQWAKRVGAKVEPHPADWARLGYRAGYNRNRTMVRLGADVVLAFSRICTKEACRTNGVHGSHGTNSTIRLAQDKEIRTVILKEGW